MNTLKLEMENCYGIQKIQQDIDFSKNNVAVIYAPNGTMKSSFAKTFEAIRDGKTVEEKVYGCKSKYSITDENSNGEWHMRCLLSWECWRCLHSSAAYGPFCFLSFLEFLLQPLDCCFYHPRKWK